jgi:hypothetical protein
VEWRQNGIDQEEGARSQPRAALRGPAGASARSGQSLDFHFLCPDRRMPRYAPAASGIRGRTRIRATCSSQSSRPGVTTVMVRSRPAPIRCAFPSTLIFRPRPERACQAAPYLDDYREDWIPIFPRICKASTSPRPICSPHYPQPRK